MLGSHGPPFFSIFLWVGGKKGLVWFTVATRLGTPHRSGDVNERNAIYYCFIVTRAISLVVYKCISVSLKVNDCRSGCQ